MKQMREMYSCDMFEVRSADHDHQRAEMDHPSIGDPAASPHREVRPPLEPDQLGLWNTLSPISYQLRRRYIAVKC